MRTKLAAIFVPLLLVSAFSHAQEIFSVNLYAYGRQIAGDVWTQESARQTVRLASTDSAGAPGFTTTGWQNGTTP